MTRRTISALLLLIGLGATTLTPISAGAVEDRIDYPGRGIEITRLSGDESRLTDTPASLKRFVRQRLDEMFEDIGSRPRCATAPTVTVDRYHSDGFARGGEGWYDPCPGGGYAIIYRKSASGWKAILGTQDFRFCQDMAWYDLPRFIADRDCLTEDFDVVRYSRADTETSSPSAVARRAISLTNGRPIVPGRLVASPAAREQLKAYAERHAYLQLQECVAAGDDNPLTTHLAGSPYGCAVTATFRNDTVEKVMMHIALDGDRLKVTSLNTYS